jgi:2-polyprenyl-6-methoxyphenol hydroxylase-like FAD-dependent oxidoreductase
MSDTPREQLASSTTADCCVVGAGPAGMILSLLLARQGLHVTLLESHRDFDREFRGDTVHPSTLNILDQLGLAERVHELPHGKLRKLEMHTPSGTFTMADLSRLGGKYPYILMTPQGRLLDLLAYEASRYEGFNLVLGATVQRLVEEGGEVRGVRYRDTAGAWHAVRAPLTVAADGRFSKLRQLGGFESIKTAPPMDVVWFRLPKHAGDPEGSAEIYIAGGHFAITLDRAHDWQIGYIILKGTFGELKAAGVAELQESLAALVPWLADRVNLLTDWKQVAVLNVESSRVQTWHKPGLLLIGDAAHVMSPVAGVGINAAVQDAVEAANVLGPPLSAGRVTPYDLAQVQRRRERPVRAIQRFQRMIQDRIAAPGLDADHEFRLPWVARFVTSVPLLRNLPARMVAYGLSPVKVDLRLLTASATRVGGNQAASHTPLEPAHLS